MSERGFFIAIEGVEGAGKSTVCDYIEKKLQKALTHPVIRVREPGGTQIAEDIRALLIRTDYSEKMDGLSELLLMVAARNQLVTQIIQPAIAKGHVVIGDRHALSSYAYQGFGREIGVEKVRLIHKLCFGDFKPDLTLYLDVSPEVGLARIQKRGETDRIEQEHVSFFEKIRNGYLSLLDEVGAICIDCEKPLAEVFLAIDKALEPVIEKTVVEKL